MEDALSTLWMDANDSLALDKRRQLKKGKHSSTWQMAPGTVKVGWAGRGDRDTTPGTSATEAFLSSHRHR